MKYCTRTVDDYLAELGLCNPAVSKLSGKGLFTSINYFEPTG